MCDVKLDVNNKKYYIKKIMRNGKQKFIKII